MVTRLLDKLATSPSHPMPEPTSSEPATRAIKLEALIVPDAPEALDEEDYLDVPYWRDSNWANHTERQKERGKPVSKLGFLTDEAGDLVSESRIKEFTSHAKQVWNELYRHRLDPSSWMKKTPTTASYFNNEMKRKFPEFCYCEGNWKVERFAITKYPDWCRDVREPGRLTRACILPSLFFNVLISFRPRCSAVQAQDR
jgi:hypothetical protein